MEIEKSLKVKGALNLDIKEAELLLAIYTKCIKYYLSFE